MGVYELMAAYSARTGLKPMGPHRPLADRLWRELTEPCPDCGGNVMAGPRSSFQCERCEGTGHVLRPGGREALVERVAAEFPDAVLGAAHKSGLDADLNVQGGRTFCGHDGVTEFLQEAVDRILWRLQSVRDEPLAESLIDAVGRWISSSATQVGVDAEGTVIPFDRLPDLANLADLTPLEDMCDAARLEEIEAAEEITADEQRECLRSWLEAAFDEDVAAYPGYRIVELLGSQGARCYCLCLVEGDGLTGLEYTIHGFTGTVDRAMAHLRETVGIVDADWASAPDDVVEALIRHGL